MAGYAEEYVAKAKACMDEFHRLNEIAMSYQNRCEFAKAQEYFKQAEHKHNEADRWHQEITQRFNSGR